MRCNDKLRMKNKKSYIQFLCSFGAILGMGVVAYKAFDFQEQKDFDKYRSTANYSTAEVQNKKDSIKGDSQKRAPASVDDDADERGNQERFRPRIGPYRPGLKAKPTLQRGSGEVARNISVNEGINFEMDGRGFVLTDNAYSINKNDFDPNTQRIIEQRPGNQIIVVSDEVPTSPFEKVVKNQDTGNYAVFTGKLFIKLFDPYQADIVIERVMEISPENLSRPKLDYTKADTIRVVSFIFDDYNQTMEFYNTAKGPEFDDLIERINIKLIENFRDEK